MFKALVKMNFTSGPLVKAAVCYYFLKQTLGFLFHGNKEIWLMEE